MDNLGVGQKVRVTLEDGTLITIKVLRKKPWLERWPGFLLACFIVLFWEAAWLSDIFGHRSIWFSSFWFGFSLLFFAKDLRSVRVRFPRSA